jgi:hypothetical protein
VSYYNQCGSLAAVQFKQGFLYLFARFSIQVSGRLICKKDIRLIDIGTSYTYALLLSAG